MEIALLSAVALGVLVGLILALTGAGGGVLGVPLLMFGLNLRLAQAAPVALLAAGIAAAMGALMGLRTAHVRYRAAALMAATGFAGAPFGLRLAQRVPNSPLMLVFACVLAISALRMLLLARGARLKGPYPARRLQAPCAMDPVVGRLRWTPTCASVLGGAGLLAGVLSSLLGVGGGFVIVPALMRVTDLDMASVTATSLAVIALIAAGSLALTWAAGRPILWSAAAPFVAGTTAGLLAGRRIAPRLPGWRLQQIFAVFGLLVAIVLVIRSSSA